MSVFDQKQLLSSIHPYDLLSERALEKLMGKMDIAYYPAKTVLIGPRVRAEHLYIIIKGRVNEFIDEELHNVYGELDSFDAAALIYGNTQSRFEVEEDLICYELPKATFLSLLQDYESFQHYFMDDFIARQRSLKQRQMHSELSPFMVAKVGEIYLHAPCFVSPQSSIRSALERMKAKKAHAIIVDGEEEAGIVTDTNLRECVLLGSAGMDDAIRSIATYPLITIERRDFLFNALLLFTKHGIKRLAVTENRRVVGILEQLDLLSHFASHSHLVAVQIDKAEEIESLVPVQRDLFHLVQSLHSKGVKVRYISKLVSELNAKIYCKVFELSVPEPLRSRCALIVMGSEGRNEQVLRTDQDNALIVSDDADAESFAPHMETFSAFLDRLGFPPCPGNVMVSNPEWRKTLKAYKKAIDGWVGTMDETALQRLSIFLDARCVAGDEALLDEAKRHLFARFEGRDDVLAHMAKAALAFPSPLSLFSGFVLGKKEHRDELDLKKGGIFAIVHGIRTLALQYRVEATNTVERIKALQRAGLFDERSADELIEAFDTLLTIRLHSQLMRRKTGEGGDYVKPGTLGKIERDLLKDSFKVVSTFKKFLTHHFHLSVVM
jgi:CBS domain-containing protein